MSGESVLSLCRAGDWEVAVTKVRADPDGARSKDSSGRLPLHLALRDKASPEVVVALLEAFKEGAQAVDKYKRLPLHWALECKASPGVVVALLEAFKEGAQAEDRYKMLPLHLAAMSNASPEVVVALLKAFKEGAQAEDVVKRLPLHYAAENKASPEVVVALLEAFKEGAQAVDKYKSLPLHLAAMSNASPEVGAALLEAFKEGAQAEDLGKMLPLYWAARNKASPEVVVALLDAFKEGAQAEDSEGSLPLHHAAANKAPIEVVEALLQANPQAAAEKNKNGKLPLHLAEELVQHALLAPVASADYSPAACNAWHAVVKDARFASLVREEVTRRPELANWKSSENNTAHYAACLECRVAMDDALAFAGRYALRQLAHKSATCVVFIADDLRKPGGQQEVALKLMLSHDHFLREVDTRVQHKLSPDHVVGVLRAHLDSGVPDAEEVVGRWAGEVKVDVVRAFEPHLRSWMAEEAAEYRYCVVLERADRDLHTAITHERFAGRDSLKVRSIASEVLKALRHMHKQGVIHGDLKPLNIMRVGETWRLIDLDASCPIRQRFGNKRPSTGYCPPEMADAIAAAGGDPARLKGYRAQVAYDMWSFGVVVFQLVTGRTLWHTDQDDNIDEAALEELAEWSSAACSKRLEGVSEPVARSLLEKLLEAEPQDRMRHFPNGAEDVLADEFFQVSVRDSQAAHLPGMCTGPALARPPHLNRIEEAQNLIRAPEASPNAPHGGFLIQWMVAVHPGVSKADDQMLISFLNGVKDALQSMTREVDNIIRAKEKLVDIKQRALDNPPWVGRSNAAADEERCREGLQRATDALKAAQEQLEDIRQLEDYRDLWYLQSLSQQLFHFRNFPAHRRPGSAAAIRRHARFILSTCLLFFLCLKHMVHRNPQLTGWTNLQEKARREAELTSWAHRCHELLQEQAEEDCTHAIPDDALTHDSGLGSELYGMAFRYFIDVDKKDAEGILARACALPRPVDGDDMAWLEKATQHLQLAFEIADGRKAVFFDDAGWGWALAIELLQSARGELPAWTTDRDGGLLVGHRQLELRGRLALFFGGRSRPLPAAQAKLKIEELRRSDIKLLLP